MQAARSSDHEPAARTIGVQELQAEAEEIVREVSESGRSIDIVRNGQVAARISPALPPDPAIVNPASMEERGQAIHVWLRKMDDVSREIGAVWPTGVSAQDVIDDVRGSW